MLEFKENSIEKKEISLSKLFPFPPFSFSHFSSNLLANVLFTSTLQVIIIPHYYCTVDHLYPLQKHIWFKGSILCLLNSVE